MDTSSEYTFPIFISSTDYNLKDFRAELARYLSELGYRPILSSAEGFPDNSPHLEPWESCIEVLENSFVMILIIDGIYSSALEWPNYKELFKERKISPTHGEYLFAHQARKRMLVFIRKEVIVYYQAYRQAYSKNAKDDDRTKAAMETILPKYIDYETLKFVHEVKTSKPIPWIKEFNDITDVKKEVQKKMLNELAEIFLIKDSHLKTIIGSFNKVLASSSAEEQIKILTKVDATKPFIEAVSKSQELTQKLDETQTLLDKVKEENSGDKEKYELQITDLKLKLQKLEKDIQTNDATDFYIKNGLVQFKSPTSGKSNSWLSNAGSSIFSSLSNSVCDKCQNIYSSDSNFFTLAPMFKNFNDCPNCKRHLCRKCWPQDGGIYMFTEERTSKDVCPDCLKNQTVAVAAKP